jgi:phosphoenolpyruvate carboxykinase (ATP)
MILIGGSFYAGEMKKSVFTTLNYYLAGRKRDADALLGQRRQGRATSRCSSASPAPARPRCSADPNRTLIGDDEHGWGPHGVFNFEGGCYAKTHQALARGRARDLRRDPALRLGAGECRLRSRDAHRSTSTISRRPRTRASAYPLEFIPNASRTRPRRHAEEPRDCSPPTPSA